MNGVILWRFDKHFEKSRFLDLGIIRQRMIPFARNDSRCVRTVSELYFAIAESWRTVLIKVVVARVRVRSRR